VKFPTLPFVTNNMDNDYSWKPVNKYPGFYEVRSFIAVLTTEGLIVPNLCQINPQNTTLSYLVRIHFIVFPSTPRYSTWRFYFRFLHQSPAGISLLPPYVLHVPSIKSFIIIFSDRYK
jgi:hypothetical protein